MSKVLTDDEAKGVAELGGAKTMNPTTTVELTVEASADNVRVTRNLAEGAVGWDVDVQLWVDREKYEGEVTLCPSEYDRSPSRWGNPDHWVSGELLSKLRSLPEPLYFAALDSIEVAAAVAVIEEEE